MFCARDNFLHKTHKYALDFWYAGKLSKDWIQGLLLYNYPLIPCYNYYIIILKTYSNKIIIWRKRYPYDCFIITNNHCWWLESNKIKVALGKFEYSLVTTYYILRTISHFQFICVQFIYLKFLILEEIFNLNEIYKVSSHLPIIGV